MSFEKVVAWVATLPRAELDKPYMKINDRFYTPREMLQEVRKRTRVGVEILRRFLAMPKHQSPRVGNPQGLSEGELEELAEARLRAWLARQPPGKPVVYVLGQALPGPPLRGGGVTPEELLREVDEKTPEGKKLIEREKRYLEYLENLKARV